MPLKIGNIKDQNRIQRPMYVDSQDQKAYYFFEFLKTTISTASLRNVVAPRDAFTVSESLRIRHDWIGRLCIVQDSIDDKNKNTSTM